MSAEKVAQEVTFSRFRRKVQDAELLSVATEKLIAELNFTGRLSVVIQNGRILKSGYEEGYFTRRQERRLMP